MQPTTNPNMVASSNDEEQRLAAEYGKRCHSDNIHHSAALERQVKSAERLDCCCIEGELTVNSRGLFWKILLGVARHSASQRKARKSMKTW